MTTRNDAREYLAGYLSALTEVSLETGERMADELLDDLKDQGIAVVKAADLNQNLAAMAGWQGRALKVIEAANQLMLDVVTGDGDPTALAQALVEGGWDGRFPTTEEAR